MEGRETSNQSTQNSTGNLRKYHSHDNDGLTGSAVVANLPRMISNVTFKTETPALDSPEDQQRRDNYMYKASQDPKCRASSEHATAHRRGENSTPSSVMRYLTDD